MPKTDIEKCAKILDCERKNKFDSKLSHRILILAGYYVTEERVREYMESLNKNTLSLQEIKEFVKKNTNLNPPSEEEFSNLLKLIDVGKSGEIDLDLLKYGLTTVGSNKFNSTETEEFFKAMNINTSETKSVRIDTFSKNISNLLSAFK